MSTLALNTKFAKSSSRLSYEQRRYNQATEWQERASEAARGIFFLGKISAEGVKVVVDKIRGIEKPVPDYRQAARKMMAMSMIEIERNPTLTDDEVFLGDPTEPESPEEELSNAA